MMLECLTYVWPAGRISHKKIMGYKVYGLPFLESMRMGLLSKWRSLRH